ncbi:ABC transporter substrate-binding protein [Desulfobacterales bacterium HSG2]|nr:ABC transporter substrate-binding protein [Desulfobacterales bacterium HSG2]
MNKKTYVTLLLILFFVLVSGVLKYFSEKPDIKIGFVAGLSGRTSELGISERAGALLAVEEINEAGGIKGRHLELVIKDDQNDPDVARKVDKELIAEGVVAIIGHATSTMSLSVIDLMNEQEMLMIAPTASTTLLSGLDDFFIRITPVSDAEMKALARVAVQRLGLRTMSVIYDLANKGLTEDNLKVFQTTYKQLKGKIISKTTFTSGTDTAFSELVRNASRVNADGIFILAGSIDAALICQQIRKLNTNLPILMAGWATTSDLIQHGGKAVEGVRYVQVIDVNSRVPAFLQFAKKLKNNFRLNPNFGAIYAYQAVYMLHTAMKNISDYNPETLKNAIISQKVFPGLQHDLVIDEFGDAKGNFELFTIKNGKYIKEE